MWRGYGKLGHTSSVSDLEVDWNTPLQRSHNRLFIQNATNPLLLAVQG